MLQVIRRILVLIIRDVCQIHKALFVLVVYVFITLKLFHSLCPFVIMTGIPCPACGLTRAGIAFLKGDFSGACSYNWTIFLWILLAIYAFTTRYIFEKRNHIIFLGTVVISIIMMIYYMLRIMGMTKYPMASVSYDGLFPIKIILQAFIEFIKRL